MCQQGIYLYGENDYYMDMAKVEIECEFYTHICNDWYYYGTLGDARRGLYKNMNILEKQTFKALMVDEMVCFIKSMI